MLRKNLGRILAMFSSIVAYLPILAGIIEPMIWPLLIASPLLYHTLYWWWEPLATIYFPAWFFFTSYIIGTTWVNKIAPFVIVSGAAILLIGLGQIASARSRKTGLVTTGLYKYVRHPQHLGIVGLSFGFLMLNAYGLRVGDIIAWTLVAFIYFLLAESEEGDLENEFGEEYLEYKRKVPFMIPFISSNYLGIPEIIPRYGLKRKLAFLGIYLLFLAMVVWMLSLAPTYHTR